MFGKTQLDREQLQALLDRIKADALITPAVLLPMLERSTTPETEQVVLGYLEDVHSQWLASAADALKRLHASLSEPARPHLESALQIAHQSIADQQARLTEFLPLLEGGNAERGRAVFLSSKVACSTCHRVGTSGGQIGPDLTTIGAIRAGRDLIESIVFPSSTIAQGFEPYTIITTEGRVISGTMARQTADIVVLRDSSGAETRMRREQIEELSRQSTSMMPEGMERLLTHEELRDLLAYLQSLR